MKIRSIFKFSSVWSVLIAAAVVVFIASHYILAESIDLTGTGMCIKSSELISGTTYVELKPAGGLACTVNGDFDTPVVVTNCVYNYNCGACVSGYKSCTKASQVPAGATCSNDPVLNQACAPDYTKPSVTITAPTVTTVSATTAFSATVTDNVAVTKVEFLVNNVVKHTATATPYSFNWDTTTASAGTNTLSVKGYDAAGNIGLASKTVSVNNTVADNINPTVSITYPAAAAKIGGNVAVAANAADASGIYKVEFYVDNYITPTTDTTSPYSFDWHTAYATNGSHTIYARAYDMVGNYETDSKTVTVDNAKPAVTLTDPTATTVSGVVVFSANATDNEGVAKVEFLVDGAVKFTDTASPYSYNWDTTVATTVAAVSNNRALSVKTYDAAGNYETAAKTVSVDNIKPAINITYPAAGKMVDGEVAVVADATDASGIYKVDFFVDDDITPISDTSSPYGFNWNTIAVVDGNHTITAKAYDIANPKNNNYATVTVAVRNATVADSIDPVVTITAPTAAIVNGATVFSANATDNVGVIKVEFLVDDVVVFTDTASPYSYNWDTTVATAVSSAVNGVRKLSAIAYDAKGNDGMASKNVTVSNSIKCDYAYGKWSLVCDDSNNRTRPYTATPAGCYEDPAPVTKESCKIVSCASYDYGSWSDCRDGKQVRSILSKLPASCADTSTAVLEKICSIVSCADYKYSDWGACAADGSQVRTVASKLPAGCTDSGSAVLKRKCVYAAPCASYSYSDWSTCSGSGIQTRQVVSKIPSGCEGGIVPESERKCVVKNNDSCVYGYSKWGNCESSGSQTRKIISLSPENCLRDSEPVLQQACDYVPPVVSGPEVFPCVYSYSSWGACVAKKQARMVLSAVPTGCDAAVAPQISRDCDAALAVLPPHAADAPVPAPVSMLSVAPKNASNLNDRTDPAWQKYYFGSSDCRDEKVCAGAADPDNDNLNNNDEYRFGTNPNSPDTDRDGRVDGDEIENGRDPLLANSATSSDAVVYESPKENGKELGQIYQVVNTDYDKEKGELDISGKALPNSYVTIYMYSKDPVILTVKTDSDGNWLYTVDKPEHGSHEVYLVVNENNGKVAAKSPMFSFVQTAEAATPTGQGNPINMEKAPAPAKARLWEGSLIFIGAGLGGLVLTLLAIGLARSIGGQKKEQ